MPRSKILIASAALAFCFSPTLAFADCVVTCVQTNDDGQCVATHQECTGMEIHGDPNAPPPPPSDDSSGDDSN